MPVNTQKKKSLQPNSAAAMAMGRTKAAPSRRTPVARSRRHARYASGSIVVAATCLASVAPAAARPAPALRPRSASNTAAHISGSMNTSKLAAWLSSTTSPTLATRYSSAAANAARSPHRRLAIAASSNAVATCAADGQQPDPHQLVGAGDASGGRVEVRDQRRLAIDHVVVQVATVVDHSRLRGEERFVGVQDLRAHEAGKVRDRGDDDDDDREPPARDPAVRGGARWFSVDDLHGTDSLAPTSPGPCRGSGRIAAARPGEPFPSDHCGAWP